VGAKVMSGRRQNFPWVMRCRFGRSCRACRFIILNCITVVADSFAGARDGVDDHGDGGRLRDGEIAVWRVAIDSRRLLCHDWPDRKPDNINIMLGKAGRSRWLGIRGISAVWRVIRSTIQWRRSGKSKGGGGWHHPCSPWGKLAKGGKSRRKKKYSDSMILERRKK